MKQREIKFRAWIPKHKKMETGLFGLRSDGQTSFNSIAIIMQYTGYKDKNGVEIYEGDILQSSFSDKEAKEYGCNNFTELVYFSFGSFRVTEGDYKNLDELTMTLEECFSDNSIVIGNIYQTPELHKNT